MNRYGTLVVVALLLALGSGCAGLLGPSDQDLVMDVVEQWHAGFNGRDGDALVEMLSEDYRDARGLTRDSFGDIMSELDSYGVGDVDISEVTVAVDGDSATAGPMSIEMEGRQNMFDMSLQKEEDGVWRITNIGGD